MDILFVVHFLNGFLMIVMPVVLAICLTRQWKLGGRIWWIGVATFILSQVGHIPFNWGISKLLNQTGMVAWSPTTQLIFNAVFLGLSAGIFEEGMRYLVLRWWAKDVRSWRKGVLFGTGHGGAEAIILGAFVLYGFFQMAALRNTDLSKVIHANQIALVQIQVTTYWNSTWYGSLLGALERFFAIPAQIVLAVMVMQAFTRKHIHWLFLAIGYHALSDASAIISVKYLGTYWTEAIICGFAILSVILIFKLRQPEPALEIQPAGSEPVLSTPEARWRDFGEHGKHEASISMIHAEDLTKRFKETLAVDGLNLDVAEGEVFGFLGPNGAGKTTTVRMLTSLISPTNGSATLAGFRLGISDTEIRRTVGVLTETPGMYDNLSAEYNLRIFAELYEVKAVQRQVEKYLKMLGLWERRFDAAGTFSKGMKQKLAIARALLHEPRILFLDEPTAGLDPEGAHLVREFITELKKEGRTIFLCTHNLDEADHLCDRVGVFKTRLLVVDTPARLRASIFGRKVIFHLRSADEIIAEPVRRLPFVREVKVIENKLVVTLDEPEIRNPDIVRTLVQAGADIQFVGELRHSLEDVYLQLVKNA